MLITTALLALSAASASASTLTVAVHDNGTGGPAGHTSLGAAIVVTAIDNSPANVTVTKSTDELDLLLTAGAGTTLQLDTATLAQTQCRIVTAATEIACTRHGVDPSVTSIPNLTNLRFVLGTGTNTINTAASPMSASITTSDLSAPSTPTTPSTPVSELVTTPTTPAASDAAPVPGAVVAINRTLAPDARQLLLQQRTTRLSAQLAAGLDGAAPRALSNGWKIIRSAAPTDTFVITLLLPVAGHSPVVLASGQLAVGKSTVTLKRNAGVTAKQWHAALTGARLVSRVQIIEPDGLTATASTALHLG